MLTRLKWVYAAGLTTVSFACSLGDSQSPDEAGVQIVVSPLDYRGVMVQLVGLPDTAITGVEYPVDVRRAADNCRRPAPAPWSWISTGDRLLIETTLLDSVTTVGSTLCGDVTAILRRAPLTIGADPGQRWIQITLVAADPRGGFANLVRSIPVRAGGAADR